jgi:hypothetical protein
VEVVASLSQGRTAAAQYGLFIHKSVPVIFEPPCIMNCSLHALSKIILSVSSGLYDSIQRPNSVSSSGLRGLSYSLKGVEKP